MSRGPLQWRSGRREYLIFSVMPCISERRPLSDTIGAAFVICSRDDPFVVPANNCHREAAEIPASQKFEKLSFGVLYQLGRCRHWSPLDVTARFGHGRMPFGEI
jgi:hypothetical protein